MYNESSRGTDSSEQFQSGQDKELPEARLFTGKRSGANPVIGQVTPSSDMNDAGGDDDGSTNDGPDRDLAFKTAEVPVIGRANGPESRTGAFSAKGNPTGFTASSGVGAGK